MVVVGTLHAGIGATKANVFLSTKNLPPVHPSMLKRREREIGAAAESLAKRSCEAALDEECRLTEDTECESAGEEYSEMNYNKGTM